MMRLVLMLATLLLIQCNSDLKENKEIFLEDNYPDSLVKTLIGDWGGRGKENAMWRITKDSIYYYQDLKSYYFKIENRDMIIFRDSVKGILHNVHVFNDTLFFQNDIGLLVRGYRKTNSDQIP